MMRAWSWMSFVVLLAACQADPLDEPLAESEQASIFDDIIIWDPGWYDPPACGAAPGTWLYEDWIGAPWPLYGITDRAATFVYEAADQPGRLYAIGVDVDHDQVLWVMNLPAGERVTFMAMLEQMNDQVVMTDYGARAFVRNHVALKGGGPVPQPGPGGDPPEQWIARARGAFEAIESSPPVFCIN
jgi:hypothetical protein